MDGLTLKITSGNLKALSLAKTLITTPALINTDIRQGAVYALPLQVETNYKNASAEVSESLVIATNSKEQLSDNVAPGSRSWNLSGYIKGIPQLEPSNYFQPFVRLHTDILWNWRDRGAVLTYKDGDSHFYTRVVIKDLKTGQQKDSANATPFQMTLKEINVMETSLADLPDTGAGDAARLMKSIPAIGSAIGAPLALGMTAAETAEELTA